MEELLDLKQRLEGQRPASWQELPDIALYMDQIISYMPRQLIHFDEGEALTSAMVNNYIKEGLVPRADGKRYGPIHLGYLTAVSALKRSSPCGIPGFCWPPDRPATKRRRSCIPTSAPRWTGHWQIPQIPSMKTLPGRICPDWLWTWLCAVTPISWPAPVFWIFFSPPTRSRRKRGKNDPVSITSVRRFSYV